METQTKQKPQKVQIRNLGKGTHIFGAAYTHPNGDVKEQAVCSCALIELGPKGSPKDTADLTYDQFVFYADETMENRVNSREFAVFVDGRDVRPDLAKRDAPRARKTSEATESDASVETSVLAEILAEGEPKPE